MGVGAGFCMYDVVVIKFTFAISSPDELLYKRSPNEMFGESVGRRVGPLPLWWLYDLWQFGKIWKILLFRLSLRILTADYGQHSQQSSVAVAWRRVCEAVLSGVWYKQRTASCSLCGTCPIFRGLPENRKTPQDAARRRQKPQTQQKRNTT